MGIGGGNEGAEEGEDAAFEEFVAVGEVVDDFGVGDEEAALAGGGFFGEGGFEEVPEAGEGVGVVGEGGVGEFEGGGGDDERAEEGAVACFIYAGEDHVRVPTGTLGESIALGGETAKCGGGREGSEKGGKESMGWGCLGGGMGVYSGAFGGAMGVNYKAELVGVFGYPVAENPTCVMQEAAFGAAGLNWRYLTVEVRPENLAEALRGMRAMGFRGINLTVPHKVAAVGLLDEVRPDAALIGAVNTVRVEGGGRLVGENTDGKGFLRGVREDARLDPRGKRVVILGAGGAARAIAVELALAGAGRMTIVNRGVERGRQMVRELVARTGAAAEFVALGGGYRVGGEAEILVNATSVGLYPDVAAMPAVGLEEARPDLLVCDAVPNPPETRLIQEARQRGFRVLNGLSMLVYQGAIGFEMWTGRKADEAVMKAALERAFAG